MLTLNYRLNPDGHIFGRESELNFGRLPFHKQIDEIIHEGDNITVTIDAKKEKDVQETVRLITQTIRKQMSGREFGLYRIDYHNTAYMISRIEEELPLSDDDDILVRILEEDETVLAFTREQNGTFTQEEIVYILKELFEAIDEVKQLEELMDDPDDCDLSEMKDEAGGFFTAVGSILKALLKD